MGKGIVKIRLLNAEPQLQCGVNFITKRGKPGAVWYNLFKMSRSYFCNV